MTTSEQPATASEKMYFTGAAFQWTMSLEAMGAAIPDAQFSDDEVWDAYRDAKSAVNQDAIDRKLHRSGWESSDQPGLLYEPMRLLAFHHGAPDSLDAEVLDALADYFEAVAS